MTQGRGACAGWVTEASTSAGPGLCLKATVIPKSSPAAHLCAATGEDITAHFKGEGLSPGRLADWLKTTAGSFHGLLHTAESPATCQPASLGLSPPREHNAAFLPGRVWSWVEVKWPRCV